MISCTTCAVEYAKPLPGTCPICADERQYLPRTGQSWSTPDDFAGSGARIEVDELLPGLVGVTAVGVGIGQQAKIVSTSEGVVVWDPPGWYDDHLLRLLADSGPIRAIASSHPHMFGAQVELARALGEVPVLVNEADASWLGRRDPLIELWSGTHDITESVTLHQIGGHFPGSAVLHWPAGAAGRGVLLTGDTIMANSDQSTVSFLRSYPNRIPLSATVVERIAAAVRPLTFDYLHSNFAARIEQGAHESVQFSARRHAAWVRGEHDDLT